MFGPILDLAIGMIFFYLIFSLLVSAFNEFFAWSVALRAKTLRRGIGQLLEDPIAGPGLMTKVKAWIAASEKKLELKPADPSKPGVDPNAERVKKWDALASELYNHPLIKTLSQEGDLPSYIPSSNFATALIDLLKEKAGHAGPANLIDPNDPTKTITEEQVVKKIKETIENLPVKRLRDTLSALLDESVTKIDQARTRIANWYDDSMTRVSGWYRRYTQKAVVIFGILIAIGFNADTIAVARALNTDPDLRKAVDAEAVKWVNKQTDDCTKKGATDSPEYLDCVTAKWSQASTAITAAKLPVGWTWDRWEHFLRPDGQAFDFLHEFLPSLLLKLLGLFLTVLAISQGAPFWFDLLNRVVNLRTNGQAPDPAQKPAAPTA
jgi:hypothetical protein